MSLPYLSPFSRSDKKYFSSNTSTYLSSGHLSNGHLKLQTPFPSYPPGHITITRCFPPRRYSIHCSLSNIYNVTRHSFSRPRCPRNNTGKLFARKLITFSTFLTDKQICPGSKVSNKLVSSFITDLMGSAHLSIGISTSHPHVFVLSHHPPFSLVMSTGIAFS